MIFTEQVKDILVKVLENHLSDMMILVFNEFICSQVNDIEITYHKFETILKSQMTAHGVPIHRDVLLRLMCYKIFILVKAERKHIFRVADEHLNDSEVERTKAKMLNFQVFESIVKDVLGHENDIEEQ